MCRFDPCRPNDTLFIDPVKGYVLEIKNEELKMMGGAGRRRGGSVLAGMKGVVLGKPAAAGVAIALTVVF